MGPPQRNSGLCSISINVNTMELETLSQLNNKYYHCTKHRPWSFNHFRYIGHCWALPSYIRSCRHFQSNQNGKEGRRPSVTPCDRLCHHVGTSIGKHDHKRVCRHWSTTWYYVYTGMKLLFFFQNSEQPFAFQMLLFLCQKKGQFKIWWKNVTSCHTYLQFNCSQVKSEKAKKARDVSKWLLLNS